MEDRTKHILIGIIMGIVIGIAVFYMLLTFRVIGPFGFGSPGDFPGPGNLTNLTRPFRG